MQKYVLKLETIKQKKKMSMYDLAIDVGVSYTVLRKFLKGQKNITCNNFAKIYNYIQNESD